MFIEKQWSKIVIILIGGMLLLVAGGIYTFPEFISSRIASKRASIIEWICADKDISNKISCFESQFADIAFQGGSDRAFHILSALQKIDADASKCHFIAHGIGRGVYKRDPENWRKAIDSLSYECSYGALTGVVEEYLSSFFLSQISKNSVADICGFDPPRDCNHAVGHMLFVKTAGDIDEALKFCSGLKNFSQYHLCLTGVFMERMAGHAVMMHSGFPGRDADLLISTDSRLLEFENLCRSYKESEAAACWEMIGHVAAVRFFEDPEQLIQFCARAQSKEAGEQCLHMAINDIAAGHNFDLEGASQVCRASQFPAEAFERDCYLYLVESLLTVVPHRASEAIHFCGLLDAEFRGSCFSHVGEVLRANTVFSRKEINTICGNAPKEFMALCRGSSNQSI